MRVIDALKTFDTIFVITGGGPGTASETINMLLYQTAFGYYNLGYASAIVVVFFALILVISVALLRHAAAGAVAMSAVAGSGPTMKLPRGEARGR